ncbi:hypothetical protein PLICRDRAFT_97435 [Plicaturopsis crispa FD-325 SS-3]|nr:hypothetical protein PLICRDRAFT_97435 [Plicaturopsis crispa FD-325 SS-3]
MPSPSTRPHRHDTYFLPDGNIIFRIENTLFNVHRFFLTRDSSFFRDLLSFYVGPGLDSFPLHDPIALDGIHSIDFECLLGIFYPRDYGTYTATTVEEWTSILNLAALWEFDSIKALAIRELAKIATPVDKIVLGRKHDIDEWLFDAYRSLCVRPDALSLEEGLRLGMQETISISEARQEIRRSRIITDAVPVVVSRKFGVECPSALSSKAHATNREPSVSPHRLASPRSWTSSSEVLNHARTGNGGSSRTLVGRPASAASSFMWPRARTPSPSFGFACDAL